ncbi:hypothetical protein DWX43_12235 [Clostridium sp. AF19-22AC]|jgi:hypothetical protein|uniref:alpha-1,2-fucosyltransferase n=1 Tax=Clostridia TaxID=186801 RepID=UPI000E4E5BC7|nr:MULTISPECIES: alpha-1,2-fucosyltransferase [Clostridia]RHR28703.1 hypothetical protein DWX43_12235 [Clostridium sp. AF19-22AC]
MLTVLSDGNGQMCNKILFQANVLASACYRGYIVEYYAMKRYDSFCYSEPELDKILKVRTEEPKRRLLFARIWRKLMLKLNVESKKVIMVGTNHQESIKKALSQDMLIKHRVFLYGWPFYDLEALRATGDMIRTYFAPTSEMKQKIQGLLCGIKKGKEDCLLIGIHLRKGDYKEWRNGEFYYTNDIYKQYMLDIALSMKERCIFVMFSNEPVETSEFIDSAYDIYVSHGTAYEDFHLMERCDYLVGPPSSFSGLASFFGKVPRYMMMNGTRKFDSKDLHIWLEETNTWGDT